MYVQSLAAFGFDAISATDPEQAYRHAWDFHPDIVVTDLRLRAGDGWQLLRDLKREARTREIPVVLLTGYHEPSLRERAALEGCAGFFVKPCLPDKLATELRCPQCDAGGAERVPPVVTESRLRWFRCRGCGHLWSIAPPASSLP